MDHNPFLKPWRSSRPNKVAGKGRIEDDEVVENIVWQTRPASPSAYEHALADGLIACFEKGIEEIEPLVDCLNEQGLLGPDGVAWTAESLRREMARLGS